MPSLFAKSQSAQRLDELKKLSLFVNLSNRELKIVSGWMHEREYLKDEVIFDEGEEGQAIYFVLKGRVLICPQGQADKPYAFLGCSESFGELALLDDLPRSGQARAAEACTLGVFFRGDFLRLMNSHVVIASKITLQLARHLAVRLRGTARYTHEPL